MIEYYSSASLIAILYSNTIAGVTIDKVPDERVSLVFFSFTPFFLVF